MNNSENKSAAHETLVRHNLYNCFGIARCREQNNFTDYIGKRQKEF